MKAAVAALALLLIAVASYAYMRNPAGSLKLLTHPMALFQSSPATPVATDKSVAPPSASPVVTAPTPAVPAANPVPVPTPPPMPAQNSAPVVASPPPPVIKPWAPPDVLPAQPNWTWETSDGKTYQNVVVTKIEPEMVSITHSMGVGHISISTLPPEIQKQLNYDSVAAEAARVETKRELEHPYYRLAALAEAQTAARQLHRPLAWMDSQLDYSTADPQLNPWADLTRMALDDLKSKAIVIFLDSNNDLPALSPIIRDQQLFQLDDGVLPGGHHFEAPKIVFSDADVTKAFGRVSHTQMVASREVAIDKVLDSIAKDPAAQALLNGQTASPVVTTVAPAAIVPVPAPSPAPAVITPVPAPSPAPSAPAVTAPASAPVAAAWAPPDIMPAQLNWTWETSDGRTYQNVVVTKIEPDTVSITHSMGVAHIPIANLPPEIQKRLNYNPQAASQLVALINDKLVSADGTAAPNPGASVKYYAIYYSAQWCPPCHHFTPELVEWYNKFKPSHKNFELIFVSEDNSEQEMLAYMKEMTMPWPAMRFSELNHARSFKGPGIEKFAGSGIPDLVLVDADGKVLSDSFHGDEYVGPEQVIKGTRRLFRLRAFSIKV